MSIRSFLSNLAGRDALEEDDDADPAAGAADALDGCSCAGADDPLLVFPETGLLDVDAADVVVGRCCRCCCSDASDKVVVAAVGPGLGYAARPYLEL